VFNGTPKGIAYSPEGIAERWLKTFVPDVSAVQIEKRGRYLWELFFYTSHPYLEDEAAHRAYEAQDTKQILFFQCHGRGKFGYDIPELVLTGKLTLQELNRCPDGFAVAPDFSWTYVHSHEGDDFFCTC